MVIFITILGFGVWVWVRLRPIDSIISKGCSMAPNPSESALLASLQAGLFHWKTFSTAANTQLDEKEENRNLIGSRWIFQSIDCGILQSRLEEHGASF